MQMPNKSVSNILSGGFAMINVCLPGTGGTVPLKDRWLTCLWIEYNGKAALIDCGEGTQLALAESGCKLSKIEAIFITHVHADHIAGLPGLLLTMGNHGRTEPVTVYAPIGTHYIIGNLCSICPFIPFALHVKELDIDEEAHAEWNGFDVNVLPLRHTMPCLGYSFTMHRRPVFSPEKAEDMGIPKQLWSVLHKGGEIELDGRKITCEMVTDAARDPIKITYMTDTQYFSKMTEFAEKSDLLVCEGMYGDNGSDGKAHEKGHMLFAQSAAVAADSGSKELWLTHFSPSMDNPFDYAEIAQEIFPNTVIPADGMKCAL